MIMWSPFLLDAMAGLRDDAVPSCPQCKENPAYLAEHSGLVGPLTAPRRDARAVRHDHDLGHRTRRRRRRRPPARLLPAVRRLPALAGALAAGQVPGPRGRGRRPAALYRRLGRARERRRAARAAQPVLLARVDRLAGRRRAQLPALGVRGRSGRAARRAERPAADHQGARRRDRGRDRARRPPPGAHRPRSSGSRRRSRRDRGAAPDRDLPRRRQRPPAARARPTRRARGARAAGRCRREAFAYIAGGAGTGATMRANRAGFDRWRIVPRMLRDVSRARHRRRAVRPAAASRRSCSAPIGVLEMVAPTRPTSRSPAPPRAEGVPMIFSNQASTPMEDVRRGARRHARAGSSSTGARRTSWSRASSRRAEACGCEAIVVTLDTTLLGWRTRDLDLAYLPFLRGKGIAQYTSDPVFRRIVASDAGAAPARTSSRSRRRRRSARSSSSTRAYPDRFVRGAALGPARARPCRRFVRIYSRPSLTWEDLPFLRERTKLPILLKGILHPDDARARGRRGHGRRDRLQPRRPPGRRRDRRRSTRCPASSTAVGGRVPVHARQRRARRRRRLQGARARRHRGRHRAAVRLRPGDRRRGRRARGARRTSRPTSTSRSGSPAIARSPSSAPRR